MYYCVFAHKLMLQGIGSKWRSEDNSQELVLFLWLWVPASSRLPSHQLPSFSFFIYSFFLSKERSVLPQVSSIFSMLVKMTLNF